MVAAKKAEVGFVALLSLVLATELLFCFALRSDDHCSCSFKFRNLMCLPARRRTKQSSCFGSRRLA
jgi:hypothetical protein